MDLFGAISGLLSWRSDLWDHGVYLEVQVLPQVAHSFLLHLSSLQLGAPACCAAELPAVVQRRMRICLYLESQQPIIWGYFVSIVGYFEIEWPVVLGTWLSR